MLNVRSVGLALVAMLVTTSARAQQNRADLVLLSGLDGVHDAVLVGEWAAEDDEAGFDEPVHERRVFVPSGLLRQGPRRVPLRPGALDYDMEHHRVSSMIQFASKLSPPSNENDCCQRAEDDVCPSSRSEP